VDYSVHEKLAFFDELEKIAQAPVGAALRATKEIAGKIPGGAIAKHWKVPALLGAGGATAITGEQAFQDWLLGRRIRKQSGM